MVQRERGAVEADERACRVFGLAMPMGEGKGWRGGRMEGGGDGRDGISQGPQDAMMGAGKDFYLLCSG